MLDDLESNDSKTHWNLVNSSKAKIDKIQIDLKRVLTQTHGMNNLKTMKSEKSTFNDRLHVGKLTQILSGTNHMRTFIDAIIKDKEILNSISKLKTNKASSLDRIKKKEMIK